MFSPICSTSCGCFLNQGGTMTADSRGSRCTKMPRSFERSSNASATSFFGGRGCEFDISFFVRNESVSWGRVTAQRRGKCYYGLVHLRTPSVRCVVPAGVFDAFGWCASDVLEWRAARWDTATPIDGADPARMVFVVRPGAAEFLPREPAFAHAFGLGLTDEDALAPWAIDDATDLLFARRVRPGDALWLAADNLNALFWGLHDWAHFHNHGPFVQRAWTELQCDATALAWLWANRDRVPGMQETRWERLRVEAEALSRARFAAEGMEWAEGELAAGRGRGR